jgi:hypothetical protein
MYRSLYKMHERALHRGSKILIRSAWGGDYRAGRGLS